MIDEKGGTRKIGCHGIFILTVGYPVIAIRWLCKVVIFGVYLFQTRNRTKGAHVLSGPLTIVLHKSQNRSLVGVPFGLVSVLIPFIVVGIYFQNLYLILGIIPHVHQQVGVEFLVALFDNLRVFHQEC